MGTASSPLELVTTVAGAAQMHGIADGTIRQYIQRHKEDMIRRGVIRKNGKVWLILKSEAAHIWGK